MTMLDRGSRFADQQRSRPSPPAFCNWSIAPTLASKAKSTLRACGRPARASKPCAVRCWRSRFFESFGSLSERRAPHFSRDEFWKHCVATACCAGADGHGDRGEKGRHAPGVPDPSEAFICGLLHDLGKIALESILPKSFTRVVEAADLLRGNIADVERTVIGLDHMVVGKRLAERWNLPAIVRDCIWLHGQLPQALPANVKQPRMVNLITLADTLVREQHLGYSGNYTFAASKQGLLDAVGLTAEQID